ncbi:MAG: hypothetical protein JKY88_18395 [Pseudomonadales bacterium]|nr:hypothetical protein [Pseudomonadales bacterium]
MPSIIRYWINIALMSMFAYASYRVLMASYISYEGANLATFLFLASPWLLLYSSIKSWRRCAIWRKTAASKYSPHGLARGQLHTPKKINAPSILERACIPFLLLAIAAILKEFHVSNIGLWVAIIVMTWMIFGNQFRRLG